MAVYTQVGAEEAAELLARYDVGDLVALKGIAEGVENSNYFVETTRSRYILTLYEKRVDPEDLPFFYALLGHLHAAGCKVPRFIDDRDGNWLQQLCGRPACLIEFLSGFSVSTPTAVQAQATGKALGDMHKALADFTMERPNSLGVAAFRPLAMRCGTDALDSISPGLSERIFAECDYVEAHWPVHLPVAAIHADLFPDNVLILDDRVSGLIDFYFACTDIRGYDLAVTHAAWSFSSDGADYHPEIGRALLSGYEQSHGSDRATRDAFPILARAACLRFLLTRCFDWINTPKSAIVTQKDPLAFLRRLDFYTDRFDKL
ncbi:homoserine kinase [Sphingorhabdus arenilitoris]|uniref:Homoserine kinase n=1 Tax=Sphingorhabdus arenilitoris TaxID=1490041 RepID=A0ABV8RHM5_9SPHN